MKIPEEEAGVTTKVVPAFVMTPAVDGRLLELCSTLTTLVVDV